MEPPFEHLAEAIGARTPSRQTDQAHIARALGTLLLQSLQKEPGYAAVTPFGARLIEALWPAPGEEMQAEARLQAVQADIAAMTDMDAQKRAADLLARLGHMHQMAGLLLRDMTLDSATTPTTAESFLEGSFNRTGGLPYTRVEDAVAALNRPRMEMTFTGHPTNTNGLSSMIAQREIARQLHRFRAGAADAAEVTAAFDQYAHAPLLPERKDAPPGLTVRDEVQVMLHFLNNAYSDLDPIYAGYDRALTKRFADYDPARLKLGLRYHSWGSSGDKDGNGRVNADTTLYGLAAHYQQALLRYQQDLRGINGLEDWKKHIDAAQGVASGVLREIEAELDTTGHLSEGLHDQLRQSLKDAVAPLDAASFQQAIEALPRSEETLSLARHVHTFGFSFGSLEFRETAEEFTRIMEALVPDYPADEEGRRAALSALLDAPEAMAILQQKLKQLGAGAEGKPYGKEVGPIAYHTRKRLELAREFPHAIGNHVLAECQDASNLLELLVLQHATTDEQGARATLGIIPLYEDREPISRAPGVLKVALANPHYRAHLSAVATQQGEPAAQQVQLAHSDNARRNGLPAARGLIYRAHQQLRDAMGEINAHSADPVQLQFYEGGSLSDPYRGGVRALSAAINEFGLHDFSKLTVQGGDLLNYFNLPQSIYRLMMRNLTHNAARLEGGRTQVSREQPIIDALIGTAEEYTALFTSPEINDFLTQVGFAEETKAGNTSSRAAARSNGAAQAVDVTKTRTISFSEGFQHAGLTPTWIGSLSLPEQLHAQAIPVESPRALKRYYDVSPVFKDAIDRMLFGLVRSDMPYLAERSGNHPLMARFEREYAQAFKLCMEAYTGKPLAHFTHGATLSPKEQHALLIHEIYPHVADMFAEQDRFTALNRSMKRAWMGDAPLSATNTLPMLLHNGMDTVLHGRLPLLDDPTYATLYCRERGIVRPHGPAASAHLAA